MVALVPRAEPLCPDIYRSFQAMKNEKRPKMHRVNDDFFRRFRVKGGGWKWSGPELMDHVTKWAKKYPRDVHIAGIDDTFFAGSYLVLVLHRVGNRLWGTTVYVLTQCDGEPPKEFFMYPGHALCLRRALQVLEGYKPYDDACLSSNSRRKMHRLWAGKYETILGTKVPMLER